MLLDSTRSQLLMVDMQERLVPAMQGAEKLVRHARLLLEAADEIGIPLTASEQYPKGLGGTLRELSAIDAPRLAKCEFACHQNDAIADRLDSLNRPQLIVFGVEAHVCVLQTAILAVQRGYSVAVVADASSSRSEHSHAIAMARLAANGVHVVTAEMVVFEWLGSADAASFKGLSRSIRDLTIA